MGDRFLGQLSSWLADPVVAGWVLAGVLLSFVLLILLCWRVSGKLSRHRDEARHLSAELARRQDEIARQNALFSELQTRFDAETQLSRQQSLRAEQAETRLEDRISRLAELSEERDGLNDALFSTRQQVAALQSELAQLRLAAEKDRERAAHDLKQLRDLREEMTGQFRLMANETLRSQGADMQKAHGEQLNALLNPFREQVLHFQRELRDRNRILDEEGARLRDQIANLGTEASALTRALKGDKQKQGAWGEMILERILEESGLERGLHYDLQVSWTDEDGKTWRPDVIVKMPQKKILVVDSKVSLNAYEQAVNSEDDLERTAALKRHVDAIRAHINTLAAKGYDRMDDGAVDYVLMFIPIEGAFSEALRVDPNLASYAMDKRVGLTTPTTLMLTLRTVEHIWMVERRESNALEIARRAGAIYDKVAGFVDSLDAVGVALGKASDAHRMAVDRLSRGQGNVIRQVEMLRELGARAQKRISMDHDKSDALPAPDKE
ncbi:DNA recombination protein RmuC [Paracoccus aerodenitrificans]|uniref:DNA recombination protein RmuC n=1 Tax=Paracoccus aerodenitrificans TaxID=3017781 RepID=UPI0022F0E4BC|nr:DNA recombination protein RmuC [Paracoccus aerodenitrificans]WBU65152.1 DNA recombination protein RmuC [Paracoccus aerodenitrificans]